MRFRISFVIFNGKTSEGLKTDNEQNCDIKKVKKHADKGQWQQRNANYAKVSFCVEDFASFLWFGKIIFGVFCAF